MLVKLDHFPKFQGKVFKKKSLTPPPFFFATDVMDSFLKNILHIPTLEFYKDQDADIDTSKVSHLFLLANSKEIR